MVDVLMAAGAFYLIVAAIGALLTLAMAAFIITSIMGVWNEVDKNFRRFDGR